MQAVVLLDGGLENHVALRKHLDAPVLTLPAIMKEHSLTQWLDEAAASLDEVLHVCTR